jgi:hypothetical protein
VPYPQYSITTTEELFAGNGVNKGEIHAKNATGELEFNDTDLSSGFFQVKGTVTTPVAGDKVQVLSPGSRMILKSEVAGLVVGNEVILGTEVDSVISGNKSSLIHVGRVFEIYTRNTDASKKKVTAAGDLVVVETIGV